MKIGRTELVWLFCIALIIFIFTMLKCKSDREMYLTKAAYAAMKDSMVTYKDSNGELVNKISVITTDRDFFEKEVIEKDAYLTKLMRFVKREKKAKDALISEVETLSEGSVKTEVIYKTKIVEIGSDVSKEDSLTYIFPEYQGRWDDKWSKGYILATQDSIYRKVSFTNEFEIWETEKNVGTWLNPIMAKTVHWKNLNPNTETKNMRQWSVSAPKPKRFVLMFGPNISLSTDGKIKTGVGISAGIKILER